jgi:hypothetical protein
MLSGESQVKTLNHIKAWCNHYEVDEQSLMGRFLFVPIVPQLANKADVDGLIHYLHSRVPHGVPTVIYIDTLQRSISGGDPNDFKSMSVVVENLEYLGKMMNGPVVLIAHPAKGKKGGEVMGSSVVGNDSAAQWDVMCYEKGKPVICASHPKAIRRLRVTRQKGSDLVLSFDARVITVPIGGEDQFGRPRSGGVLLADESGAGMVNTTPLADGQDELIHTLHAGGMSQTQIAFDLGVSRHRVRMVLAKKDTKNTTNHANAGA